MATSPPFCCAPSASTPRSGDRRRSACHFLGVAAFDDVDVDVTTLRATRRTESLRVSMRQADAPVAEAIVWCVARDLDGPEVTSAAMPDVAPPHECPRIEELADEHERSPHRFWANFESRPISWRSRQEWVERRDWHPRSVWSHDGRRLGSGTQQLIFRTLPSSA